MTTQVRRDVVIVHGEGRPRAWLAATHRFVDVTLADVEILDRLMSGDVVAEDEAAALRDRGLLVEGQGAFHDRPPDPESRRAEDPPATDAAVELRAHVALSAGPRGFVTRLPRGSGLGVDEVDVPPGVAAPLLATVMPGSASDVAERANVSAQVARRAVAWGLARGVLGPPLRRRSAPPPHSASPRRGDSAAPPSPATRRLEDRRPDGRVPVYAIHDPATAHLPLALGLVEACARKAATRDGVPLTERLAFLPTLDRTAADVVRAFMTFGPGVWLLSNYMWSVDDNMRLAAFVHRLSRQNLIVCGGPSTPSYPDAEREFLEKNPAVAFGVRGEGERTATELLERVASLGLEGAREEPLAGTTRWRDGAAVRAPDRERQRDIDAFASPYLTGVFDGYAAPITAAILETNRGCPYGCTFCDWGSATLQKIASFDLDRVFAEIEWIAARHVPCLWIADANFGIFERDVVIAERIASARERHGFPREVLVNYAKNATARLAEIVEIFHRAGIACQGTIAIQSTDTQVLRIARRTNIKTSRYDELSDIFRREALPMAVDLMLGLPGATMASLVRDLAYYFDRDVRVKVYPSRLLPNSPMADPAYMREHAIETDDDGYLVSTSSYTRSEYDAMNRLVIAFEAFDGFATLRYVLRFLAWDHGLDPLAVVQALVDAARADGVRYPSLAWVAGGMLRRGGPPFGWRSFYSDVVRVISGRWSVPTDTALETALLVNEHLMPAAGRFFPARVELAHDFVAYYEARRRGGERALRDHPPGTLDVRDPHDLSSMSSGGRQYDDHVVHWELESVLARPTPAPHFVERPTLASP